MIIRAVRTSDAEDIYAMRTLQGVYENTLGIRSERLELTQKWLEGLIPNDHIFVAEIEGKVVGSIGLHICPNPRMRHSASIGLMVHIDYQGQGIGRALMEQVINVADNWLMLKRLELGVFAENERALGLYKRMGFEIEGTKKYAAIQNGKYIDEYIMARIRGI